MPPAASTTTARALHKNIDKGNANTSTSSGSSHPGKDNFQQHEDAYILAERAKNPPTSFAAIHRALGRTGSSTSTSARYKTLLEGTTYNCWTPEEDAKLIQLRSAGNAFHAIQKQIPRHSEPGCYSRYSVLVGAKAKARLARQGEEEDGDA
ncbi:hypothetical protein JCM10449v2_001357 [Rhodotorula kratochvilovae]